MPYKLKSFWLTKYCKSSTKCFTPWDPDISLDQQVNLRSILEKIEAVHIKKEPT